VSRVLEVEFSTCCPGGGGGEMYLRQQGATKTSGRTSFLSPGILLFITSIHFDEEEILHLTELFPAV